MSAREKARKKVIALVYEQDRAGMAGEPWTVDRFVDAVLDALLDEPVPSEDWEYRSEGGTGSTNPHYSRPPVRFRRRKAGPWEVVPDGE